MNDLAIKFTDVTKKYKLYKNDRQRLLALLFGRLIHYKHKLANDRISFEIKKGEAVAVLGRNGAGKSTLLKIITGVVFPTTGEVEVNGRVSALLELTSGFDPEFTGRENLRLKAHLMGLNDQQIDAVEEEIIAFSELGDYIDQPDRTYSSGMRARLGFAINANINPEILVIDEALSVGDVKFQEKCRVHVEKIMRQEHVTVLFVTHSMESAKDFCKRGLVLVEGKLVYNGNIDKAIELYEKSLDMD